MASTIEQAIIDDLKTDTTVTGYTGNRIYFLEKSKSNLDKGTVQDYITITEPSVTRRKWVMSKDKTSQARLQFNCFSDDKWNAKAIADAVVDRYRTKRTGYVQGVHLENVEFGSGRAIPGYSKHGWAEDIIFTYSL
jgi:hypothetical protein